jgi:hypothetical protein
MYIQNSYLSSSLDVLKTYHPFQLQNNALLVLSQELGTIGRLVLLLL